MNGREYLETQLKIVSLGAQVGKLDLVGFTDWIERANLDSAARLDPAKHARAAESLTAIGELARSLMPVQTAFTKVVEVTTRNHPRTKPEDVAAGTAEIEVEKSGLDNA